MTYLFAKSLFSLFQTLPRNIAIKTGEGLGSLFWNLGYRKKVILKNLDIAFPEKDTNWKKTVGKKSLQNIGRTLAEFPKLPQYYSRGQIKDITFFEKGREIFNEKKPRILVSAHIGNWELAGASFSYYIDNLITLAYRIKNKKINDLIVSIREGAGMKIIFHDQPLKAFIKALSEGKTISFLADQNALRHRGTFVDFFNFPASTITIPAKLALKYNAEVVFGYSYYNEDTKIYHLVAEKIDFERTGNNEEDIKNLTQLYTKKIEDAVKKHPQQYFWVHKRWKTRPEGVPENVYE